MVFNRILRRWVALGGALAVVAGLPALTSGGGTAAEAAAVSLPVTEAGTRAVVSPNQGRRDVLWSSGGTLRHQYRLPGGSWGRPLDLGGSLRSQPAVVSWAPGRFDVFARGTDNRLKWRTWRAGTWSAWRSLGGVLTSAPTVASWGKGRLDVFVRGADNGLYQRTYASGTWSPWRERGGSLTSSPAAASWGVGRIDVVARTTGADLMHRSYRTGVGWSAWRNLGGALSSQPAAAAPVSGRLDVFFRAGTGQIRTRCLVLGAGWSRARSIGDMAFTSGPGATAVGDDVVVVALRNNRTVFQAVRPRPGGSWSPWRSIDMLLPFRKLATWVDVLDYASLSPSAAVADMKNRGVRTLLLSTARFNSSSDFHDEAEMGEWLDEAHSAGLRVVGWYVPAYGDMARDVRRTVAIADYVSPHGQRFDAVAVDIERYGTSGEVDLATFNARVVPHLRTVRSRSDALIGAIVPSPYATDPGNNWEGFPWPGIGPNSEVTVPMALWSFRRNANGTPFSATQVHDWVVDQIDRTQALTGGPVHVEGGVDDPGTENTPVTVARVAAFVEAVLDGGAIGGSHYDYATTRPELWPILAGING
jgi:hypothetical protein